MKLLAAIVIRRSWAVLVAIAAILALGWLVLWRRAAPTPLPAYEDDTDWLAEFRRRDPHADWCVAGGTGGWKYECQCGADRVLVNLTSTGKAEWA